MRLLQTLSAVLLIVIRSTNSETKQEIKTKQADNVTKMMVCGELTSPFFEGRLKCYDKNTTDDLKSGANFSFEDNSIFFIETSCKGGLNTREACSVESAARRHPYRQINVLFFGQVPIHCLQLEPLKTLTRYKNVNLLRMNMDTYLEGTIFKRLTVKVTLNSAWPIHHTSDLLRFVTLSKYGGIYLDLDVIVRKPFDLLPQANDWVGVEDYDYDGGWFGAGLLAVSKDKIGKKIIDTILNIFLHTYRPNLYNYNSNAILKQALVKVCGRRIFKDVKTKTSFSCKGFAVYDREYFYPMGFYKFGQYFQSQLDLRNFSKSYAFHIYNSKTYTLPIKGNSAYVKIMKSFCPLVHRKSTKLFRTIRYHGVKNTSNMSITSH